MDKPRKRKTVTDKPSENKQTMLWTSPERTSPMRINKCIIDKCSKSKSKKVQLNVMETCTVKKCLPSYNQMHVIGQ